MDIEMHLAVGLIFGIQGIIRLHAIQRSEEVVLFQRILLREILNPSPNGRGSTTHTVINRD